MWWDAVYQLAERQHGVIERFQVRSLAPSEGAARCELERGRWVREEPNVFSARGAPNTERQQLMIAVLDAGPGAVVSHRSAAALWGAPGMELLPAHLTRCRGTNGRLIGHTTIHEARHLAADQITQLDGIPVTRPERIPFDLLNIGVREARVERIVDRFWTQRLVSGRSLARVKASLPLRGFRGTAAMRRMLDARPMGWVPPASGLESRAFAILQEHGLTDFERQVDLGSGDEWIGRVDMYSPTLRVVVEVQSDTHHAALSSQRDDAARFRKLEAAGFRVVTAWESEIWYDPRRWIDQLNALKNSTASVTRTERYV